MRSKSDRGMRGASAGWSVSKESKEAKPSSDMLRVPFVGELALEPNLPEEGGGSLFANVWVKKITRLKKSREDALEPNLIRADVLC